MKTPTRLRKRVSSRVMRGVKNPLCVGLPRRVAGLRLKAGWMTTTLAKTAGISLSSWSNVEDRVTTPKVSTVEKMAAALGVSAAWLAYGPEAYEPFRKRRPPDFIAPEDPVPIPGQGLFCERFKGIGDRLRQRRLELCLSMRWVAVKALVSVQLIANTEAGTSVPKVDTCEAIAVALCIPPGLLAFGPEEPVALRPRRKRKPKAEQPDE